MKNKDELLNNLIKKIKTSSNIEEDLLDIAKKISVLYNVERVIFSEFPNKYACLDWNIKVDFLNSIKMKSIKSIEIHQETKEYLSESLINKNKIIVSDYIRESNFPEQMKQNYEELGIKSIVSVAIKQDNNVWGTMSLASAYRRHWINEEIIDLQKIATELYTEIQKIKLELKYKASLKREEAIRLITDAIGESLDTTVILNKICNVVLNLFNVDRVAIAQFASLNDYLKWTWVTEAKADDQIIDHSKVEVPYEVVEYLGENAHKEPSKIIIADMEDEAVPKFYREFHKKLGTQSILNVPIKKQNNIWGLMALFQNDYKRHWTEKDIAVMNNISDQVYNLIRQSELYSSTLQYAERENLLRILIESLRSTLDINELKSKIVSVICKAIDADRCAIMQYDNKNHVFMDVDIYSQYLSSDDIDSHIGFNLEQDEFTIFKEYFLNQNKELLVPNIDSPPINIDLKIINILKKLKIKSSYTTAITHRDEFLGILYINYMKKERIFSEDEIDFFRTLASQAAISLFQSNLFKIQKESTERESFLRQIILSSISTLDYENTINTIVNMTGDFFKANRCFFIEYNQKSKKLTFPIKSYQEYTSSDNIKKITGRIFTNEETDVYKKFIIELKQVVNTQDTAKANLTDTTKRMIIDEYGIKSYLVAPIFYQDIPIGILTLNYTDTYRKFSEDEVNLFVSVANQSAIVLYQAMLFQEVRDSKNTESLLKNITNEILISTTLKEAIYNLTKEIGKLFDVDRVVFRLFDVATKSFTAIKGEFLKNENIPSASDTNFYPSLVNDYLNYTLFIEHKNFIIENIESSNHPDIVIDTFKKLNIKSTIAFPIIYKNSPLGVIFLTNTESFNTLNDEEVEILPYIAQQVALAIHMYDLNYKLTTALNNEASLREIIINIRSAKNHKELFNYLLYKLINIFNAQRALHLHYDENYNLNLVIESVEDENFELLNKNIILSNDDLMSLSKYEIDNVVAIDNIQEIDNNELIYKFKKMNILSFVIYPIKKKLSADTTTNSIAPTMICSSVARIWTSSEISSFRLILDTAFIIYLELKQRNETEEVKQTFLATLTHDLRSPILSEQKALEVIIGKKLGTKLEEFTEYLNDIYKTNEELLRIVNNILAVYHYESGKIELTITSENISSIIKDSVKSMMHLAKDENTEIIMQIEPDLLNVLIDKNEIHRVIINLISNAIKHNKKGTNITVSAKNIDNAVQVSIKDNGGGIPSEEKNNIFQRYPTTKRKIGTGLGLYLSKQIIDAHKSKIWFESEQGKGTTFYFTIPIK
ncbi:MAG: GAF domain-containing protein [bacterium]